MNILITGAAGYIGSSLTPYLLRLGHWITAFDTFMFGRDSLLSVSGHENLTIVDECPKNLGDFDAIIHLAAIVGAKACDDNRAEAEKTNHHFAHDLAEKKRADQKFIFINTNCGYHGDYCDETSSIAAESHYAVTKMLAEKYVLNAGGISLRFASLFGVSPRMRSDLLLNFMVKEAVDNNKLELYEASYKRNFLHVFDAGRAIGHALYRLKDGEIYNVGIDDANITKLKIAEMIKKKLPNLEILLKEGPKDPDKRNSIISNAKIGRTLFETTRDINDGIKELIKYYQYARKM